MPAGWERLIFFFTMPAWCAVKKGLWHRIGAENVTPFLLKLETMRKTVTFLYEGTLKRIDTTAACLTSRPIRWL